ncbi:MULTISPECIES: hypothetical protein [unclassified Rhizobium]|uniref:hypothetical protein n=1 Tax=Rhizobium sp. PP-CC-3G-465 TaxID=2135648 RepID=UPI00104FC95C|nr:hypothetical protein C8J31_1236 [Rhizobium sp. PP-CC-2G-626]TCQ14511.1 hypothetical protein C8J33_12510 [Rhizobium sp. PP-CC-3G-465]
MTSTAAEGARAAASADDVRRCLTNLMPSTTRFWSRPIKDYAAFAYKTAPFAANISIRAHAMTLLQKRVEAAALRSGYGICQAKAAAAELKEKPVLQTGPHCLLLFEPDAFYTHLFSLMGLQARERDWHITYCVSTTSFSESAKKGAGWLRLDGTPLNLFGLPRSRIDRSSIGCLNGPYRFALTDPAGNIAPNASAVRLLGQLPSGSYSSAAEAIKVANQHLWNGRFSGQTKLLQLDDFDIADLLADHFEDEQSWLATGFAGKTDVAKAILGEIDRLNSGPWAGWVRRTTDLFWRLERDRIIPLRLEGGVLRSSREQEFQLTFAPSDLASALRRRDILPSLLTAFLVMSILPGVRVLGGCRQTVYLPLLRHIAAVGVRLSGANDLLKDMRGDTLPGMWGHRVIAPEGSDPYRELEAADSVSALLARYAEKTLVETSGELSAFTRDPIWAEISRRLTSGERIRDQEEWRWA